VLWDYEPLRASHAEIESHAGIARRGAAGDGAGAPRLNSVAAIVAGRAVQHDAVGGDVYAVGGCAYLNGRRAFDDLAGGAAGNAGSPAGTSDAAPGRSVVAENDSTDAAIKCSHVFDVHLSASGVIGGDVAAEPPTRGAIANGGVRAPADDADAVSNAASGTDELEAAKV
jgi:hypothetical protein